MIDSISATDFEVYINTTFHLESAEGLSSDAVLVEVKELASPAKGMNMRKPFSILFKSPVQKEDGQGMFNISHPGLGSFDLFMIPVDKKDGHTFYEAVFN